MDKVELVRSVVGPYPLKAALSVLELARSTWYYRRDGRTSYEEKYARLRSPLEEIARAYPEYGYRRVQTELREAYGEDVNHKVIRRLHQLWNLPLLRSTRPPKPSGVRQAIRAAGKHANLVRGLASIGPLDVLYTDFTELVYAGGRAKAHLIVLLDHLTKLVLGHAVATSANTALARAAWDQAVLRMAALGFTAKGRIVHHDRDSVFTSYEWTSRLLLVDGCRVSYALRGASDNPEMESFFGRFKVENRSLIQDAETMPQLTEITAKRIQHYNRRRRHSALGNRPPLEYFEAIREEGELRHEIEPERQKTDG
jgi:putative transposase